MKNIIGILLVAIVVLAGCKSSPPQVKKFVSLSSADGPPCPCCPDCGTNGTPPPEFIPAEYPLDALLIRKSILAFSGTNESGIYLATTNYPFVKTTNNTLMFGGAATLVPEFGTNNNFKVATYTTNTIANHLYVSQFASTLPGPWSDYTDSWTNAMNVEKLQYCYISNPMNINGFFRTRDITLQWLTNAVNHANGTGSCGGGYTASSTFYFPNTNVWGFTPDYNTKIHKVSCPGASAIEVVGRFGQNWCGVGQEITLTNASDPFFRWTVVFDVDPGSNCVVMLTGFKIETP